MSNPTRGSCWKPALRATATAPTIPPAGPDRIVSFARRLPMGCRAPLEVITRIRVAAPRARCT